MQRPSFLTHNGFYIQPIRKGVKSGWQAQVIPFDNGRQDGPRIVPVNRSMVVLVKGPRDMNDQFPTRADAVRYAQVSINSKNYFQVSHDEGKTWKLRELSIYNGFWNLDMKERKTVGEIKELVQRIRAGEQVALHRELGYTVLVRAFQQVQ